MSAGDEAIRRRADELASRLEAERARPVPGAGKVVAVDRDDLMALFRDFADSDRWRGMSQAAFTAAERIAAAAGIRWP